MNLPLQEWRYAAIGGGTRAPSTPNHSWVHPSAEIGERTVIFPHVYIGPRVEIGDDCVIGPGVCIGSNGFGYELHEDAWHYRLHPFGVIIGSGVSIGANTVIDRGRHRDTEIGRGTKIDASCFIAHNVHIGAHCLVIANSMIAGSAEIGDRCWIGPSAQITDHAKVGEGARVGLGSVVLKDVPDRQVWVGNPARYLRDV